MHCLLKAFNAVTGLDIQLDSHPEDRTAFIPEELIPAALSAGFAPVCFGPFATFSSANGAVFDSSEFIVNELRRGIKAVLCCNIKDTYHAIWAELLDGELVIRDMARFYPTADFIDNLCVLEAYLFYPINPQMDSISAVGIWRNT